MYYLSDFFNAKNKQHADSMRLDNQKANVEKNFNGMQFVSPCCYAIPLDDDDSIHADSFQCCQCYERYHQSDLTNVDDVIPANPDATGVAV